MAQITAASGDALRMPVEIDWVKNRLYFNAVDSADSIGGIPYPKKVLITYTDAGGNTQNETHFVQLMDEDFGQSGKTFGNLTSLMVNEGQVSAFKDPTANKIWVFWASTRDGNSDLYYETISPKFAGQEYK
jgi:hypothetical protein